MGGGFYSKKCIRVTTPDMAPTESHYAIFTFFSVTYDLYGKGDGGEAGWKYDAYLDKKDWIAEIEYLESRKAHGHDTKYVAVKVGAPAKPVIKIEVREDDEKAESISMCASCGGTGLVDDRPEGPAQARCEACFGSGRRRT